jgi:preprotein translocase subunit SecB
MKPAPSQLECKAYFVTSISLHASTCYKTGAPITLELEDLRVEGDVVKPCDETPVWQVTLKVSQEIIHGKNVPYDFSVEIVGLFDIVKIDDVKINDPEKFVRVNGSSLLFGVVREIVRSNTATGPYAPILLPTVNFCPYREVSELKVAETKTIEPPKAASPTKTRARKSRKIMDAPKSYSDCPKNSEITRRAIGIQRTARRAVPTM